MGTEQVSKRGGGKRGGTTTNPITNMMGGRSATWGGGGANFGGTTTNPITNMMGGGGNGNRRTEQVLSYHQHDGSYPYHQHDGWGGNGNRGTEQVSNMGGGSRGGTTTNPITNMMGGGGNGNRGREQVLSYHQHDGSYPYHQHDFLYHINSRKPNRDSVPPLD